MNVNVIKAEVSANKVVITAQNLEAVLFEMDPFAEEEAPIVTFCFPRDPEHPGAMTYLFKVLQSQPKCRTARSLGEKLALLEKDGGTVLYLSDGFIVKAKKK